MSSVVLMRILESAPARYDAGMRMLSLGGIGAVHRAVADLAVPAAPARVLEIGCGTGMLTEQLLARGARVEAFDQNPEMLDRARAKLAAVPSERLALRDSTAAEIDALPAASFDAVVASLVLSEMSAGERGYVLRHARDLLVAGGRLVVADEVVPCSQWQRVVHRIVRLPLAVLTWVVTGTTTHAVADLEGEMAAAGFEIFARRRMQLGSMSIVGARRPQ